MFRFSLYQGASLSVLAALLASTPSAAQQAEQLPELIVTAPTGPTSLTAPGPAAAIAEAAKVPGAVSVVEDSEFKQKQAVTTKDVLDYVPGVFVQPKWGEDARLSIRGSGISRNYHLRGVLMYMDGIPINTADGYGDFQEIDPSAYRFVQIYKGANALSLGANTFGGVINFVTPTGYDTARMQGSLVAGSFGYLREQVSAGGVNGRADYFVTLSHQRQDGFRNHSDGASFRGSANIGFKLGDSAETRFYLNANSIDQKIPGEVDRATALSSPRTAAATNVTNNWQRNIDSVRLANKTVLKIDSMNIEFGGFYVNRHLMHPIYEWLDYKYDDYGFFGRINDERMIGPFRSRYTLGLQAHNGVTDAQNFDISAGAAKGALKTSARQQSNNINLYGENAFYVLPNVSLVAGLQSLFANRKQEGIFRTNAWDVPDFNRNWSLISPKIGVVYDFRKNIQLFANISRATEVPTFGQGMLVNFSNLQPQRATSLEAGTRGRSESFFWEVAAYRAAIKNEFQCVNVQWGACSEENIARSIHQGLEAGGGVAVWGSAAGDKIWTNLTYTFNDFHFDQDATWGNNQLPGIPRHYLRGEVLFKGYNGISFGPNVEWSPQAPYVDNTNSTKAAAYMLLGARFAYDSGKAWTAFVEGKNLTNRKYITSMSVVHDFAAAATTNLYNPGNGASVMAGLNLKW